MSARAFRLKQGEAVPEGVRRIARGRIDHAVEALADPREETVHEARKDMKKLRALLRLVRGEIGGKVYRRENAFFRDVARELAGVRDADVMLATLANLEERYDADVGPVRQAVEAHRLRVAGGSRGRAAEAATAMLREARARVDEWPLERDGFEAVEDGLRRTYRGGRRGWRAALADPSSENLHAWRKRVKDLWYHCSLLEESWKPVMKALGDEAHELSDRLGDDHDLSVLLEFGAEGLEEPIATRRRELQEEAFAYGGRLYVDKPKVFVRRVERWYRPVPVASSPG
ncbi:MAG TPA: CHAD domain-containing protein [Thermoleophilaceae bacterium]|nr:CHAD domain-containing protein [Thermoleophilaceae bacterium]